MDVLKLSKDITGLHEAAVNAAKARQEMLIKPMGSLGSLEDISIQFAGITGNVSNRIDKKILFLFGADNGIYAQGVSAAPQHFTNVLLNCYGANMNAGINVICEHNHVDLKVIDMGVIGEVDYTNIYNRKLMENGTNDFSVEPSMSPETAEAAIEVGFEFAKYAYDNGYQIIGTGEVGMANTTTSAACIIAAMNLNDCDLAVGRGGGLTDTAYEKKREIIKNALVKHKPNSQDVVDILSKVGGLDIAALVGLYIGAAYYRIPIVIDGVISIAAALLAYKINPLTKDFMIPSHISEEPAYLLAAEELKIKPLLNLGMRLGEGTGCPISMGVVENALAVINNMYTFEQMTMESEYRKQLKTK